MTKELLKISVESLPIPTLTKNRLIESGFLFVDDFKEKFAEDIKEINGIGDKGFLELKEALFKYKIKLKRRPKEKILKDQEQSKKIVSKFLEHNKFIRWGAELKMAQKLLDLYGKDIFLVEPFKFTKSLNYYLSKNGEEYIVKFLPKTISKTVDKKEYEKEEDSFDQDVELVDFGNKPRTLGSFFKKKI